MSQLQQQSTVRNRLLAALPPDDFAALAPALQPVCLDFKQVLYEPGQAIQAVHFVERGMVSMLAPLEDGHLQEVGVVGREGLVGLPVVLGAKRSTIEAMVQMQGPALRLGAAALRAAFDRSAPFRDLLLRYAQAFHTQVAQTAACNGRHPARPLAAAAPRPGRAGRVPGDPRVPLAHARGASARHLGRRRRPAAGGP